MKQIISKVAGVFLSAAVVFGQMSFQPVGSNLQPTGIIIKQLELVKNPGTTITGAACTNNYEGVFIANRTVTLSEFYMSKFEVTQAQYKSVMEGQTVTIDGEEKTLNANPSYCSGSNEDYKIDFEKDHSNHPVENVTWFDAVYYCNALSKKENLKPCYDITVKAVNEYGNITNATVTLTQDENGYRLPTEAEWEYAARGGEPTKPDWNYSFSGTDKAEGTNYDDLKNLGLDNVGWYCYNNITGKTGGTDVIYDEEGCGTHEVGKKAANRLGLYDMSGNVWEWCYDWYGSVAAEIETDPAGVVSGDSRVYRGGSWYDVASSASVSSRHYYYPSGQDDCLGFRVVRTAN